MPRDRGVAGLHRLMQEHSDPKKLARDLKRTVPLPSDLLPEEAKKNPSLAHGVGSQFEGCEVCQGLGVVKNDYPIEHERFGKLEPCPACRGTAGQDRLRKLSRLNHDLLQADLKLFDPRDSLGTVAQRIATWMRGNYGWLTLTGPHGTGKTYLLAAIANIYIAQGTTALYTTVADLLGDLQATFNPNSNQVYSSLFASVMNVDVLLLDEAEKWHATQWAQVQVFRMLEHRSRYLSKYRTVLATNTDLRPLEIAPGSTSLYPDALYPNYIESRICGGMIISDFWNETDLRPIMAAARTPMPEDEEWEQRELI